MEISIVIAEDELITRIELLRLLDWEAHDCRIVGEAHNGQEAISLIEKLHPELVITDVQMPVMSGLNVIKHFKEADYRPEFLIVSGFDDYELVREGLTLGAYDYLLKMDLNEKKLINTIRSLKERLLAIQSRKTEEKTREIVERRLRRNINDLRRDFFADIIKGYPMTDIVLKEEMRFLDIRLNMSNVCCLILNIGAGNGLEDIPYEQLVHLNYAVRMIIDDILTEEHHAYVFEGRPNEFIALASPVKENSDELACLLSTAKRIVEMLRIYLNLSVKVSLGWCKNEEKCIESAHKRAEKALDSRLFNTDHILIWTDIPEYIDMSFEQDNQICDVRITRAKEYIQNNFDKNLSLSLVAEVCGFNSSYFSSLFARHVNMTFSEYINQVRIENAKRLLREAECKVYEIAGLCGYKDTAYFFRVFKKLTGQSPGEYCKKAAQHVLYR